jgi:hypothetical protein
MPCGPSGDSPDLFGSAVVVVPGDPHLSKVVVIRKRDRSAAVHSIVSVIVSVIVLQIVSDAVQSTWLATGSSRFNRLGNCRERHLAAGSDRECPSCSFVRQDKVAGPLLAQVPAVV